MTLRGVSEMWTGIFAIDGTRIKRVDVTIQIFGNRFLVSIPSNYLERYLIRIIDHGSWIIETLSFLLNGTIHSEISRLRSIATLHVNRTIVSRSTFLDFKSFQSARKIISSVQFKFHSIVRNRASYFYKSLLR